MKKFLNFDDFYAHHCSDFDLILKAKSELKSPMQLAQSGSALVEAEALSFIFLNHMNRCSDLKFGLSASVLDAKDIMKKTEAEIFKLSDSKTASAKEKDVKSHPLFLEKSSTFNELSDTKEYLDIKYQDFSSTHYYYKNLAGGNNG